MDNLKIIILILFFGMMGQTYVYMHEDIHALVCEDFGGTVTEYHVGIYNGYVLCEYDSITTDQYFAATSLNIQNEIASSIIFMFLSLGFIMSIMQVMNTEDLIYNSKKNYRWN